jgi:sugar phosphate isomerase/epimerase
VKLVYASVTAIGRSFLEKLEAVGPAGFDGISVSTFDYRAAREEGYSEADILAAVQGSNVEIASVGGATTWLSGTADEDEVLAMELAARFGSDTINCTPTNAPYPGLEEAASAFAGICDRAAPRGLRCRLEFVPWTGLGDLPTAREVVRLANRPNGGLLIDNWHLERSGGTAQDLRGVPPEWIFGVQLSDGLAEPGERDSRTDAFQRLLPGEGELDVVGFIQALAAAGASVAYEAEPINRRWDELPVSVGMRLIREAMVEVVAAARTPRVP